MMELFRTHAPRRASQGRGMSASLRRPAARRAALLAAGALIFSAGAASAAPRTFSGTGATFTAGFAGITNGDTLLFGAGTTTTVNNDVASLTLGAGTTTAAGGTYLGDAIDFNAGAPSYTLTGNAISLNGNVVNNSGVLQTINFSMVENGLTSPPYGYNFDTGTGGITLGGNVGSGTVAGGGGAGDGIFHDLNKLGTGILTLAGTDHIAADILFAGTTVVTGTHNIQYFTSIGRGSGNATLTVRGAGVYHSGDINVADLGGTTASPDLATLNVSDTAVVTAAAFFAGRNTNCTGTVNITGGSVSANAFTSIGASGTGIMNLSGGSFTSATDFNVSDLTGSQGTINLSGTGALIADTLYVGKGTNVAGDTGAGTVGTFNQTGGTVTQAGLTPSDWRIGGGNQGNTAGAGIDSQAVGVYNISAGSLTTPTNLQVGAYGNGTLNLSGTGLVSVGGNVDAGRFAGSAGLINVTGGNLNQTAAANRLIVGEAGTGTLTVGGTGTVTSTGGTVVGLTAGSSGTVNLNTGGTLNTAFVGGDAAGDGAASAGTSAFNFNGGTLTAGASSTTFFGGLTTATVTGGAIINTNGNSVTVTQSLLHGGTGRDGGLLKTGAGTLTLSGTDTYTGDTRVSAGQLSLTTAAGLGLGNLLLTSSTSPSISLLFTGTDTIGALSFTNGSTFVTPGTYGSTTSAAAFKFAAFTGSGILNVTATPEPPQFAAFGLGLLGLTGLALKARRKSAAS